MRWGAVLAPSRVKCQKKNQTNKKKPRGCAEFHQSPISGRPPPPPRFTGGWSRAQPSVSLPLIFLCFLSSVLLPRGLESTVSQNPPCLRHSLPLSFSSSYFFFLIFLSIMSVITCAHATQLSQGGCPRSGDRGLVLASRWL